MPSIVFDLGKVTVQSPKVVHDAHAFSVEIRECYRFSTRSPEDRVVRDLHPDLEVFPSEVRKRRT